LRDTQLGYKKVEGTEDERVPFGDINLKKQYVTKKGTAVAVKGISFSMTKHPACHHPSRDPRLDRGFWPYRGKAVPPHDGPALIRREDKNTARLQRREPPPCRFLRPWNLCDLAEENERKAENVPISGKNQQRIRGFALYTCIGFTTKSGNFQERAKNIL
jgi:hypothetical protein